MKDKKIRNLAVIPARGGSKRLPKKNMASLNGKPLICYTIEAAIKSRCFDEIMLSSDDETILAVADNYPVIHREKRPPGLSGDTVKVIDLICHIIDRPSMQGKFDTISLLLPTCPFRKASDIGNGFGLLTADLDSVISVTTFEFPIKLSMEIEDNTQLVNYLFNPSPLVTGDTRSQDHRPIYRPNGGFYIAWWHKLKKNRNYFVGKVKGYPMHRNYSVDIDTEIDLLFAELLLKQKIIELEF
jgi:CMP-N-acetylneuraminic acid synthetase